MMSVSLLLLQVRICPETGHEELVVITGPDQENTRPHGGMLPFALDLRSFAWRRGAFRNPAAHLAIPAARQRPGKVKLAGRWLLVGEGTPLPVSRASTGLLKKAQAITWRAAGCQIENSPRWLVHVGMLDTMVARSRSMAAVA